MLAALLSALYRNKTSPVITHADLVSGCKLQMRGSLIQRDFEDKVRRAVVLVLSLWMVTDTDIGIFWSFWN